MAKLRDIFVIGFATIISICIVSNLIRWTDEIMNGTPGSNRYQLPKLDSVLSQDRDEGMRVPMSDANRVLVMSSVGRSGSSILGQLVAHMSDSIYFFEPLHYLQLTKLDVTARRGEALLNDLYECRLSPSWFSWADYRKGVFKNLNIEKKCKNKQTSLIECVKRLCEIRSNRVIKVIRMRTSWVSEMLSRDKSLKVIHIVRDPRASFNSLVLHRMRQRNYSEWCPKIQEDLELVEILRARFPDSHLLVKYEDLCYDPEGTSLKIWQFLTGDANSSLPNSFRRYLAESTNKDAGGSFDTSRNSTKEAEAWRNEIREDILLGVERDCGRVLDMLHYNKFGSIRNTRNVSMPLRKVPL